LKSRGLTPWASAILPVGFAFFDESAKAFLRIFEAVEFVEKDVHRFLQSFAKGEAHTPENGFLGHGENRAGVRGDPRNEFVDGGIELGFGDETSDQAEFERALGSNRFAGQNDFEGALWPDQERQDRGGQGREHADGDFGLREALPASGRRAAWCIRRYPRRR